MTYHGYVDEITIESDENGFELHIDTNKGILIFNIQEVAETLYDQTKAKIGPYLREREDAEARFDGAYAAEEEAREAYALSDPNHPQHHEVFADAADLDTRNFE